MTQPTLIFATFLAPALYKTCLALTEYVERCVNIPTFLMNGEDIEDFAYGTIDAGFVGALSYAQSTSASPHLIEAIATPVVQLAGYRQTFMQCYQIVVLRDRILGTLEDLNNCVWAQSEQERRVGSGVMYEALSAQSATTLSVTKVVEVQTPAQALRLLLDGKADVTTLVSSQYDLLVRNSVEIAQRVQTVGLCTPARLSPIVVSSRMPTPLKRRVQEALLTAHEDSLLALRLEEAGIERFTAASHEHYQSLCQSYSTRLITSTPQTEWELPTVATGIC